MNEIDQGQILLPALALVGLTFIVLLLIPYRRFKAASERKVTSKDFALGESGHVPAYVALPNRNYMNLLELPVLFYFACTLYFLLETVDLIALVLAWGFVFLRIVHSVIHLSYNNVMHRLVAFASSNLVLAVMWIFLVPTILDVAIGNGQQG
ncbi:membrane-associated protein in eicosanoid and glutathione metabolism (mapeg) [Oleiphilus messinensis]|uniref:Membrane-associated protein in eicosanoid and glutathione metabolism (Mapeg) n=1 Tax=Oleiphilus messinensis TaxID=141451 RepID=A0A1Y0I9N0_9GAMM|nr:MAPEG family protein [Oleiphilus messinensis]ARU57227.1 membrane-associated protein in eicosanoid and glutathione metabolism (mapeg) [Oleiphilus messinensis]